MPVNQTKKVYDYAICIGRYSPIHLGHEKLIKKSFTISKQTILLIGSCYKPRDIKNPFTGKEREFLIRQVFPQLPRNTNQNPISVGHLHDYIYNDQKWVMQVQEIVDKLIESTGNDPDKVSICLLGGKKDNSSYYLDMFPQWDFIEYEFDPNEMPINATDIREKLFTADTNKHDKYIKPFINEKVYTWIETNIANDIQSLSGNWFMNLVMEFDHIKRYKDSWSKAPYPVTFVTVDSVIIQSGHVLMIERRACPGKGLYALPGGFLDQHETIEEGMIRELREETKLKVPIPILKGSIKQWKVFDHPSRSLRGRTITHAAFIDLGNGELSRVKGSDDAAKAFWIPFSDLNEEMIFEDHLQIINSCLGF